MRSAAGVLIAIALLAACDGDECEGDACDAAVADAATRDATEDAGAIDTGTIDAEPEDLGPIDTGVPDAGPTPDAGERFNASMCAPCSTTNPCPNGGTCLVNQDTNERYCADACDTDLYACVTGFPCLDLDPDAMRTAYFCLTPTGSCQTRGLGFGAECYGDASSCLSTHTVCEADIYAIGYCTIPCLDDTSCPPAFTCAEGDEAMPICKARFMSDAERCAREGGDLEQPCAIDLECAAGVCVRSEPALPGVCAAPCTSDTECAERTRCLSTYRGRTCLPERCTCHGVDLAEGTRDLFGEALAAAGLSRCGTIFSVSDWAITPPDVIVDDYRLGFYDRVHNEPLIIPGFAETVVKGFDASSSLPEAPTFRAARMIESMAELLDHPAIAHAPGTIDLTEPLASAVAALITEAGGSPDITALRADAADVPLDLQLALAGIVDAMQRAVVARRSAIETQVQPEAVVALYDYGPSFVAARSDFRGLSPTVRGNRRIFNEWFQYGEMYGAAVDLLDAIAEADLPRFALAATASVAT
jgi:hypothetical protein